MGMKINDQPKAGHSKFKIGCAVFSLGMLAICAVVIILVAATAASDNGKTYQVAYFVTTSNGHGQGNGAADITYTNADGGTEQQTIAGTYQTIFTAKAGMPVYISAQNGNDGGSVSCSITINGASWKDATSTGGYTIATCNGLVGSD